MHLLAHLWHELLERLVQTGVIVGGVIAGFTLKDINLFLSTLALLVSIIWGVVQITLAIRRYQKEEKKV